MSLRRSFTATAQTEKNQGHVQGSETLRPGSGSLILKLLCGPDEPQRREGTQLTGPRRDRTCSGSILSFLNNPCESVTSREVKGHKHSLTLVHSSCLDPSGSGHDTRRYKSHVFLNWSQMNASGG